MYERNPLMQLFYLLLVAGGLAVFMRTMYHHLPLHHVYVCLSLALSLAPDALANLTLDACQYRLLVDLVTRGLLVHQGLVQRSGHHHQGQPRAREPALSR